MNLKLFSYLFCLIIAISILFGLISATFALFIGIIIGLAQLLDDQFLKFSSKLQKSMLQLSVIGLGFGISLGDALLVGTQGFYISLITIVVTFIVAFVLRRFIGSEKKLTFLIASGTAICGGSAIAAVSPSIKADSSQTSVALAVVFVLNAIALFIFPPIGQYFELSNSQFGIWCALAIHDTSSVVGASSAFGTEALEIATTAKLVRAFWIVPLVLVISLSLRSENKIAFPWFIGGFLLAVVFSSSFPQFSLLSESVVWISRKALIFTLFLVGLQINIPQLKHLGFKSLAVGSFVWVTLMVLSLVYVINFY